MKIIKYIDDFILDENASIRQAMLYINSLGDKYGANLMFIIIVDQNNILKGTLTDGDIRRGIIAGLKLDSEIHQCMNKNPVKGKFDNNKYNNNIIKNLDDEITFLPLVNGKGVLKELLILDEDKKDINILLLAGGFGKRLGKITKNLPKPLVKIANKPIIEYVLKKLEEINNTNITYISLHYHADQIINYIDNRKCNLNIEYVIEKKPMGTIGSASLLKKSNNDLLVINSDIYSKLKLSNLISFHRNNKFDATIAIANYEVNIPFGIINYDNNNNFLGINEKPNFNYYISAGMYVLSSKVVSLIGKGDYKDMPDLLEEAKRFGLNIGLFPIHEVWNDIGNKKDLEAQNKLMNDKK